MRPAKRSRLIDILAFLTLLLGTVVGASPARAQSPTPETPVYLYLFWGEGCPHCAKAKPYLESLPSRYPGLVLRFYEIYYNEENQALFARMAEKHGVERLAVPTIFIGSYYLQGYSEEMNPSIDKVVGGCMQNGCVDPGEGILTPSPAGTPQAQPTASSILSQTADPNPQAPSPINNAETLNIPFFGSVDLSMQSALVSTALIAFVDGVNPCSIWVLTMLLALTLHTGSRKKIFLIGLIFLTVTAGIYALFIVGLFSVLKIASFLGWIQTVVALLALFFAAVNIKDYFWYKKGISFTIADDKKSTIFTRMRAVMDASQSVWGLAGATVFLAAGVSMVEFSCTAGFPVVWTNLLAAQNVSGLAFVLLLLIYMLIYQLDEMVIFFSAVISLKSTRLEEKQGRILKLIGGMLMLTLSVVMLVNPAWMNSVASSLVVFGIAFLATLIVLFVHRVLLPKFQVRPVARRTRRRSKTRIESHN